MKQSVILRRRRTLAKSPWTRERIEYLVARWSRGVSGRQISGELGRGISRSVVISLVHRLGTAGLSPFGGGRSGRTAVRAQGARKPSAANRQVTTDRCLPPAPVSGTKPNAADPGVDAEIPPSQRRSLQELTDDTCRWPVGDPRAADFFFCGAPPLPDKPYCAAHCARAELIDETEPPPFEAVSSSGEPLWVMDAADAPELDDIRDRDQEEWEDA